MKKEYQEVMGETASGRPASQAKLALAHQANRALQPPTQTSMPTQIKKADSGNEEMAGKKARIIC